MSAAPGSAARDAPGVGRLAPSPTGRLHLGHARSFLLAWWHARSRGDRLLLRFEDLDRARLRPGMIDSCRRDLEWLGLDWDGAEELQSEHTRPMEEACERLLAAGLAYRCDCSRKDVERALSAPHVGDGELRYPGTCRERDSSGEDPARPLALRLRVPPGPVTITDGLSGTHTFDVQAEVGDFLLARRDGFFAYQLAVVVDDARAGVTEVVRGDDLLSSAARQALLQRALGLPHPRWWHVPLVLDEHGERLAKRRDDVALASLREEGCDGRAVVAWAARSAGLACPDRIAPAEALPGFDLARIPRTPVRFGPGELEAVRVR